jgi:hypothetical protein
MRSPQTPSEKIMGLAILLGLIAISALPEDKGKEKYLRPKKLTDDFLSQGGKQPWES